MPTLELSLEQLAKSIKQLSPDELETLEIMLNKNLSNELNQRWTKAKKEKAEQKLISKKEVFEGL